MVTWEWLIQELQNKYIFYTQLLRVEGIISVHMLFASQ